MIYKWLGKLPVREQVWLGVAIACIFLLLADKLVVQSVAANIQQMNVDISILENQIEYGRKTLRLKDSVETRYKKVSNLIGESGSEQEAIENLKGIVDEIANRNGVGLKSMQHLTPDPLDFLTTYFVDVSEFTTDSLKLMNFLHEIQTVPGMLRIKQLVVNAKDTSNEVTGSIKISKVMTKGAEKPGTETTNDQSSVTNNQ